MEISTYDNLLNAAFRFVSYRPHSEREIVEFLQKTMKRWNVVGDLTIERVVKRLREYGHIDDNKFAIWWITQRNTFRPKGTRAIEYELIKKGVSRVSIKEALTNISQGEDGISERDMAKKAILKKIDMWAQLPVIEQKKKIYQFLSQRGFSPETISKIIDETGKKDYNQ